MENYDSNTFLQVWERVNDRGENIKSGEKSDREKLCFFMDKAAFSERGYLLLGQKFGRRDAVLFSLLRQGAAQSLREMMTAHFILTGDTYAPEKVKPYFPSAIDGLRDMYLRETEGAENFRKAAMETDKGSLTDLYHKMAAMSEKRAEKLMELINKALE